MLSLEELATVLGLPVEAGTPPSLAAWLTSRPSPAGHRVVYSVSLWGTEVWVHRGIRTVACVGYLAGERDQGPGFAAQLAVGPDDLMP